VVPSPLVTLNTGEIMPLKYGKKNIGKNISMLLKEGKGRKQAIAISLTQSRKRKPKK
jgi:hypothetical protein